MDYNALEKRLREPPFGTETSERNLMKEAADAIADLRARNDALEVTGHESVQYRFSRSSKEGRRMSDELVKAVRAAINAVEYAGANVVIDAQLADGEVEAFARAAIAVVIERCAKVADKRADDRFAEHGVTEFDTNAIYYSGSRAEAYDELDEEDWAIAAAIRKLGESE
jgi:hypothetical protein